MNGANYERKKAQEIACYEQSLDRKRSLLSNILHHPIFYEPKRNHFNYTFTKQEMARLVYHHLNRMKVEKLLIAPCGTGDDLKYLADLSQQVYGIDLSQLAIEQCPNTIIIQVGDIFHSGYPDKAFDLIASPLFFHHFTKYGFEPFLDEFLHILKNGGKLVVLEPSIWYPLNIITRPLKKITGNTYREVEDEGPFRHSLMLSSL